jgi:7,8-dihydroneopterin aldolase/epimerase/oxygenase
VEIFRRDARDRGDSCVLNGLLSRLTLADLRLSVRLGCEPEERLRPQPVDITIEAEFLRVPRACESDELEETVCYDKISRALQSYCENKEFRLIEKLGLELFRIAKEIAGPEISLTLHAKKVQPPVENLRGGAIFSITENKSWSS